MIVIGTNYFVASPACKTCGHSEKDLHIGKSSGGWTFSFHATDEIRSWTDWKEHLIGKTIINEYGDETTLPELIELVNRKVDSKYNHSVEAEEYGWDDCFLDPEGHSFSTAEFC